MQKYLNNNTTIKIISVLFAFILWFYVISEQNPHTTQTIRNIPVDLVNLDEESLSIYGNDSYFVDVKARARRTIMANTDREDFEATASLRGRIEGENMIRVYVSKPEDIEILDVNPYEIMVVLEKIIQDQLPLLVNLQGNALEGHTPLDPIPEMNKVTVIGPESVINSLEYGVIFVNLGNRSVDFTESYPVRIFDKNHEEVEDIKISEESLKVTVPIVETQEVEIEPNLTGEPAEGFDISEITIGPQTTFITSKNNDNEQIELNTITTEPVDISGIRENKETEANLIIPEGYKLARGESEKVQISVRLEEIIQTDLNIDNIRLINLNNNLDYQPEEITVRIRIEGYRYNINRLRPSDILVSADMEGLNEGEHRVEVIVEDLEAYNIIDIDPEYLNVTIRDKNTDS